MAGVGSEGVLEPGAGAREAVDGPAVELCPRGIVIPGVAAAAAAEVAAGVAARVDSGAGLDAAGGGLYACAQQSVGEA